MEFELIELDNKKLWLKLSGSITYYFKLWNDKLSNEELWEDYKLYAFEKYQGQYHYLDKQSLKYVIVNNEMLEKAKNVFTERLEKRRINKLGKQLKEEVKQSDPLKNNVIEFSKYRK